MEKNTKKPAMPPNKAESSPMPRGVSDKANAVRTPQSTKVLGILRLSRSCQTASTSKVARANRLTSSMDWANMTGFRVL